MHRLGKKMKFESPISLNFLFTKMRWKNAQRLKKLSPFVPMYFAFMIFLTLSSIAFVRMSAAHLQSLTTRSTNISRNRNVHL
jgi:hypothetical protein